MAELLLREDMMAETGTQLTQVFKKADETAELIARGEDITVTLTDSEKVRFEECKQIIGKNLKTFLEVGCALADIRNNRFYRETHKTFEAYCKETWDLGRTHINRKIAGYSVVQNLAPMGAKNNSDTEQQEIILPINERQARLLTRFKDPDDQVKAWDIVREKLNENPKTKLTAALISKAVKEVRGEVVKRKIKETKKAVEKTSLVSTMFKKQFQVMLDIVTAEQNAGWPTCSKKEAVRWLNNLVKIAESDD